MAQATVLYNELSVRENLRFRAGVMGLADAAGRSALALDEHGLDEVAQQRVGALSGGWRQRVAFAVAQLACPRLLLLDEPTAGLDASARASLWAKLRELVNAGVTAVVSSHDHADCNGAWQPCGRLLFDCRRRFPRTIRLLARGNHGTPSLATSKPMRATSRPSGSLPAA
jgi:ABC-type sulfate/molybdate transport systems ATPase subunit